MPDCFTMFMMLSATVALWFIASTLDQIAKAIEAKK